MLPVENSFIIIITLIPTIEENSSCRTSIISLYLLAMFFFKKMNLIKLRSLAS